MSCKLNCVSLYFTREEIALLEEAWRKDFSVKNRVEYIKIAINEHAGKKSVNPD